MSPSLRGGEGRGEGQLLLAIIFAVAASGCLRAWDADGRWACNKEQVCPAGYTCDDQICCIPGGTPSCPTLPLPGGGCADGEPLVYFQDLDHDGDGNEKLSLVFCHPPHEFEGRPPWVLTGRDCDDTRPDIFFGAPELCNGKDDNCDRVIDEGLPNLQPFYRDEDGDGVGDTSAMVPACIAPPGFSAMPGDCAPLDSSKFPGAGEQCNNLDDNCDGTPDTAVTSFIDSDTALTSRFPCLVPNARGVCLAGTFRCEVSNGAVVRACVSVKTPSLELCDGLDNDCNGAIDEAPQCGGPRNLLAQNVGANPVRYAAQRLSSGGQLTTRCQANLPGTPSIVSSDGRTWSATGTGYHVWSAEAAPGTTWDLSKLNLQLRLDFTSTALGFPDAGGSWGDPDAGAGYNPVIYVCGPTDTDFIRYRITSPPSSFRLNDTSFDQVLPLNNSSNIWLVGAGSGFDTSKVRRIEVLVFTQATSFTITFQNATGFVP